MTRVGENVPELLLISCICINHTEIESKFNIVNVVFEIESKFILFEYRERGILGKVPNRSRTDFLN